MNNEKRFSDLVVGSNSDPAPTQAADEIDLDAQVQPADAPEVSVEVVAQVQVDNEQAPVEDVPATTKVPNNFSVVGEWSSIGAASNEDAESVIFPPNMPSVVSSKLSDINPSSLGEDDKTQQWVEALMSSREAVPPGDESVDTLHRENADWCQDITSEVGSLSAGYPKHKFSPDREYTGESARMLFRSSMKLGTIFKVPLWHSGFWMSVRTPSEGSLLELLRVISADKISLGRATYGLLYSNSMVYTHRRLLDFIIEHTYETSLAVKTMDDLRGLIRLPDLAILIWAMACATWPHGFRYRRPCIADPEKCHHVVEEKVNLSRLLWTDKSLLSPRQIKHMSERQRGKTTVESLENYQADFINGQNRAVEIVPGMTIEFKIPFAQEYIDSGLRWVDTIEDTYGRALTLDETTRDAYLLDQARTTEMRQYGHCVARISLENGASFTDQKTIESLLNDASSRDDIRNSFLEEIRKFLDFSLVSVVAVPTFDCPNCHGSQVAATSPFSQELIPLDVYQTFFTLLVQRQAKIKSR